MTQKRYEVRFVIVVDHPEKRGPSFAPVDSGTRSSQVWGYEGQADAARVGDSMLDGAWDFGSEYVAKVQVLELRVGRSSRQVRKIRYRDGRDCGWYTDDQRHRHEPNHEGRRLVGEPSL